MSRGMFKSTSYSKAFSGYYPVDTDANSHIEEQEVLVSRAWDAHRNIPLARGIIETFVASVVGTGLKHHSNIKADVLGISDEEKELKEKEIERIFNETADTKDCDYYRLSNFAQLQQQAYRTQLVDGGCLGLISERKRDGELITTIKNIEAIQLSNKDNMADTEWLQGGVQFDKNGIKAYHILKQHPYSEVKFNNSWVVIPAYSGIRQNVLHLYSKERAGQRTGISILSSVLENLMMLDRMSEAKLQRAVLSAMLAMVITTEKGESLEGSTDVDENGNIVINESASYDKEKNAIVWKSGMTLELNEGQKAEILDPKPDEGYRDFTDIHLNEVASAIGMPKSILTKEFHSNYTASRGELLEFWKKVRFSRINLVADYCQPFKEIVLLNAVLNGKIQLDGFLTDRSKRLAWCNSRWEGQPMGMIDPLKELKGYELAHNNGFMSGATISTNIDGSSYEDNLDRQIREAKKEKKLFKKRNKMRNK